MTSGPNHLNRRLLTANPGLSLPPAHFLYSFPASITMCVCVFVCVEYVFFFCVLTGIRRVGCRAVEERGRSSQVGHACVVSVAVHAAGDGGVTALLRRGARHVTVWIHAAAH